jgi:hypothetical protein
VSSTSKSRETVAVDMAYLDEDRSWRLDRDQ